jgi:hypothetical protein
MSTATVGSSNDMLDKWRRQAPIFNKRWNIEYSIHGIPPRILKELKQVFPDVDLESGLIVPTFQVPVGSDVGIVWNQCFLLKALDRLPCAIWICLVAADRKELGVDRRGY